MGASLAVEARSLTTPEDYDIFQHVSLLVPEQGNIQAASKKMRGREEDEL